jgi:diguanylate cyclase (GGDEF)-like protein/PAS domain S-box-containing protein
VDALTGLSNRRTFDDFLELELKRCARSQQPISLVLLDIDHFKLFNDTYGHQEGDACLRLIAATIEKYVRRPGDLAARYGGEEFAIILPGANTEHAAQVAENLRIAIEDLQMDLVGPLSGIVTASFGVATIMAPDRSDTSASLTKSADTYLYAAKFSGRNVVVFDRMLSRLPALSRQTQAFRTSNAKDFSHVAATASFGVLFSDFTKPDNPITFANPAFTDLTGYSFEEVIGTNCRFLQGKDTNPSTVAEIACAIRAGTAITRDLLNYHKNGTPFWITLSVHPRRDELGVVVGFVATQIDVSKKYESFEEVLRLDASLARVTENLPGYIFQRVQESDDSLSFSYFSPSYWRLLGYPPPSKPMISDVFKHVDVRDVAHLKDSIGRSLKDTATASIDFRAIAVSGDVRWFRTYSTPSLMIDGRVTWDGIGIDVTPEKVIEDRLTYLAYHDALTNLFNRQKFTQAMQEAIELGQTRGQTLLVLTINLDKFRQVNDTLGSTVGDEVLKFVAARVLASSGRGAMVARLNGDEFGVFWCDTINQNVASERAETLFTILNVPMLINGNELAIKVSIGALIHELTPGEKSTSAEIAGIAQKQSGLALSEAKRAGGAQCRWYDAELDQRQQTNAILQGSLRRAIAEEQFTIMYQPLVDLRSGRIVGAEALLRWSHPDLGVQSPAMFIPMAEVTGLIVPLGDWVLKTALTEMMCWGQCSADPPRIAVNLSGTQIRDPGFMDMIERVLTETGADPERIDLELTESVLLDTIGSTVRLLERLRQRGFHLAIDDFGTGYSSFKYLQKLPVSKVKIDQTFIKDIVCNPSDKAIVRAIMAVAGSLDLEVIVEGIESKDQLACLCEEGCCVGQGFHFSRPLPAAAFRQMLRANHGLSACSNGPALLVDWSQKEPIAFPYATGKGARP